MFRGTPRMFAQDELALQLSRKSISMGLDAQILHPVMRCFFYLPFMHSEDLAVQDEGVIIYQNCFNNEPSDSLYRRSLAGNIEFMSRHREIIKRFGRFPHRNLILGREETEEERAYLANGGETF
eukprot:TRINITY_DN8522_c0_g1_i7.p1 TRINITY_DN8522_c0_g1~~TRINITY_DN8522_c0_g1_i7.p1  ORF type:complete len:124 (-),score=10.02 TRINITY_DN8522_c0_g1_i7:121-492(-)